MLYWLRRKIAKWLLTADIDIKYINDKCKLKKATSGSVAFDAVANIDEALVIRSGEIVSIPIGISLDTKESNIGTFVCTRSGISTKNGLIVVNSFGIIDSDYRGECRISFYNSGVNGDYVVQPYERVAQIMIFRTVDAHFYERSELKESFRGSGGFGHTGRF